MDEAGKENVQTLAILSLAEEATSKDEVEIEKFLQVQKSKNTQHKTKSDLRAAACKNREPHFTNHLVEFLIFRLKITLDELFSKIIF